MIKKLILCAALFILDANAGAIDFIKPCAWNDKACILDSSKLALPYFVKGIPEIGVSPVDPFTIDEVNADNGELKLLFKNIKVEGISKCEISEIERPTDKTHLRFVLHCPIVITGKYKSGGKILLVDVEGEGDTEIKTDKARIEVDIKMKTIVKDGKSYYKFTSFDYKYEPIEKLHFKLDNLFNGDKARAEPFLKLLDQSWKELAQLGNPLIKAIVMKEASNIEKIFLAMPIEEIELPA
uniref:Circadian clock-controlled protein-like n=1 Tax=Bombyx mori TaxID=7091 RepID=A0A8R2M6Q1_BOMMO|nr:circadian clock-controlled protein daywake [Bombyx mori]